MAKKPFRPLTEVKRTFQARVHGDVPELDDMAVRYNAAKRSTWSLAGKQGVSFDKLKTDICARHDLPGRVANAIATDLRGMVKSRQEKAKVDLAVAADKLVAAQKVHARLTEKASTLDKDPSTSKTKLKKAKTDAVRKGESVKRLTSKVSRLEAAVGDDRPSICFGGRDLFNAQHFLEDNGYDTHADWLRQFRAERDSQFQVVGSADEPSGNKTCRAAVNDDGSVTLTLALHAGKNAPKLALENIVLPHGHDEWTKAIAAADAEYEVSRRWQAETAAEIVKRRPEWIAKADCEQDVADAEKAFRAERKKLREKMPKVGWAVSYRFDKDKYGWRILVTVTRPVQAAVADFLKGCLALDLNEGHVARVRAAKDGSFVDYRRLDMVMSGKSTGQRRALLHDMADGLIKEAIVLGGLPIVIEKLDFSAKKARLREIGDARAARRISSFAYSQFASILRAHAALHGVAVVEVEPAYTSIIGAALHAVPLGLTVHGAAALSIARRAMKVEETIPAVMRVALPRCKTSAIMRPSDLRSKATVETWWPGWRSLANAVHVAREKAKTVRFTGTQRRSRQRNLLAAAVPY
jgi:IS605 OrfB family transposase